MGFSEGPRAEPRRKELYPEQNILEENILLLTSLYRGVGNFTLIVHKKDHLVSWEKYFWNFLGITETKIAQCEFLELKKCPNKDL